MNLHSNNSGINVGSSKFTSTFSRAMNYIKKRKKIIAIITIICVVGGYFGYRFTKQRSNSSAQSMATAMARKSSIQVSVTGTGSIVPIVDQEIGQDKSGKVEKVYVKNGDKVKKGQPLVVLHDDTLTSQLEKSKLELEKAGLSLNKTATELSYDTITAPFSGRIVSMETKTGDQVSNGGALATLQDDSQLVFDMPVSSATAKKVSLNQKVEVFLPSQGETVEGRVIVNNSDSVSGYNGQNRAYLKVAVAATGNLSPNTQAFGTLTIGGKKVDALSVSTLEWKNETQLKATLSGKVTAFVQEGRTVKKGQKLFALSSDTAYSDNQTNQVSYSQAQLDLAAAQKQIDDLTIKAPIDGFVSGMDVQAGDEVWGKSANSTTATTSGNGSLGKIINTGQMEITFSADEVDIAKLKVGQTADITVDALSDQIFKGKVTEISEEGKVTNNVASFDVTILVDNPNRLLKSGMTANITIVVAKKDNTLIIPIDALQEKNGKKFVVTPSTPGLQNGQNIKQVKVGLMNDTYAEITEGLQEGDTVLFSNVQSSSTNQKSSKQGGPGGMMGAGGPPQ